MKTRFINSNNTRTGVLAMTVLRGIVLKALRRLSASDLPSFSFNVSASYLKLLWMLVLAVLLAACGSSSGSSSDPSPGGGGPGGGGPGGGGPGGGGSAGFGVTVINITAGETGLTVNWTNPNQQGITGFNIAWVNTADLRDFGAKDLTADDVNISADARVSATIMGLMRDAAYHVVITVLYANGRVRTSAPVTSPKTGAAPGGGGGGGSGGGDATFPAVADSDIRTTVSGNTITVSWTNPSQDGQAEIIGFNINWVNVDDDADGSTKAFNPPAANVTAGAGNTDTITGLNYVATYRITVSVRYAGQDPILSAAVEDTIGADPDDIDGDGVVNADDNCPSDANADQTNTDKADDGGDACDPNDDNDDFPDETDVDDNNNSLIEIRTLDDLARLRDDLNGNGMDDGNDDITAVGSAGCPAAGCSGYELTRSLNFSDAASYNGSSVNMDDWTDRAGRGWVPIGSCSASATCTPYTGMFDGRGYAIADLFIAANSTANGIGLFAALSGTAQNLHLLNADISGGANDLGVLAGYSSDGNFQNLLVAGGVIMDTSANNVGGLLGNGNAVDIRAVSVSDVIISTAGGIVGGLIGSVFGNVRAVSVSDVNLSMSSGSAGGLAGIVTSVEELSHSYVVGGSVSGGSEIGGLVGQMALSHLLYSYSAAGPVSGRTNAGGLIGFDAASMVTSSYWDDQTTGRTTGSDNVGTGQTTAQLQNPTDFTGIYADWGKFWCDPTSFVIMENTDVNGPGGSFKRLWVLGDADQYPVLNCHPVSVAEQQQRQ